MTFNAWASSHAVCWCFRRLIVLPTHEVSRTVHTHRLTWRLGICCPPKPELTRERHRQNIAANMSEILKVIAGASIPLALLTAIAYYWLQVRLKAAVQHEYDEKVKQIDYNYNQQLEKYRADLQHQTEIANAQLQAALQIKATEHSIKLSRVFVNQSEVIATIYEMTVALMSQIDAYSKQPAGLGKQDINELINVAVAINKYKEYYQQKRLYIPTGTQAKLEKIHSRISSASLAHYMDKDMFAELNGNKEIKSLSAFLRDESPALLTSLEADFKEILGLAAK